MQTLLKTWQFRLGAALVELPESDIRHIAGDVDRVYGQLAHFWLEYMKYLKNSYPYLFSLAVRMNPFDECASAELHY